MSVIEVARLESGGDVRVGLLGRLMGRPRIRHTGSAPRPASRHLTTHHAAAPADAPPGAAILSHVQSQLLRVLPHVPVDIASSATPQPGDVSAVRVIEPSSGWLPLRVREWWDYRDL